MNLLAAILVLGLVVVGGCAVIELLDGQPLAVATIIALPIVIGLLGWRIAAR